MYKNSFKRNPIKRNPIKRRPNAVINEKPESDNTKFHDLKHVPGNSSYADVSSKGKKILIISDSMCSRIKMKEFNSYTKNGYAYRKTFPSATVNELAHYCIPTLLEDKPDTVIIHIGTNNVTKQNPSDISQELTNMVSICHNYGVNDVFISSILFRPNFNEIVC